MQLLFDDTSKDFEIVAIFTVHCYRCMCVPHLQFFAVFVVWHINSSFIFLAPHYTPWRRLAGEVQLYLYLTSALDTARGKILSPLLGIKPRSPDCPAHSQTLYWLSYPGSHKQFTLLTIFWATLTSVSFPTSELWKQSWQDHILKCQNKEGHEWKYLYLTLLNGLLNWQTLYERALCYNILGFREGISTEDATYKLTDNVLKSINKKCM
jgi:hypothetical protein